MSFAEVNKPLRILVGLCCVVLFLFIISRVFISVVSVDMVTYTDAEGHTSYEIGVTSADVIALEFPHNDYYDHWVQPDPGKLMCAVNAKSPDNKIRITDVRVDIQYGSRTVIPVKSGEFGYVLPDPGAANAIVRYRIDYQFEGKNFRFERNIPVKRTVEKKFIM